MKRIISKKTENVLRKVISAIAEEPNRLQMDTWGQFHDPDFDGKTTSVSLGDGVDVDQKIPPCRTTACIAGHCILQTRAGVNFLKENGDYEKLANGLVRVRFEYGSEEMAQSILGITDEQAERLFYLPFYTHGDNELSGWPEQFTKQYRKARTAKTRAKVAIARIEHFIQTGE